MGASRSARGGPVAQRGAGASVSFAMPPPAVSLHEAQLKRFDKLYEENKIDTATYLGLVSNLKVVA